MKVVKYLYNTHKYYVKGHIADHGPRHIKTVRNSNLYLIFITWVQGFTAIRPHLW